MPIFMKLGDIQGKATDEEHKDWIVCESLSASVFCSTVEGDQDQERSRSETTLGDVEVVRLLDETSVRLLESCVNGACFDEAEIHVCTEVRDRPEPYLKYKLKNVVISGYIFFHAVATGEPPSEEITMNCTEAEWTYIVIDPKTGETKGSVSARYSLGESPGRPAGEVTV
jgi:type VI secretion system secreted protein Hcp